MTMTLPEIILDLSAFSYSVYYIYSLYYYIQN